MSRTCDVCNKAFSERSSLLKHHCIHSGQRLHSCDVCNKAFSDKYSLIKHQHIHSGERPFACEVCSKARSQSNSDNISMHT
jgi:KRAB domain-containing zinc finger protein